MSGSTFPGSSAPFGSANPFGNSNPFGGDKTDRDAGQANQYTMHNLAEEEEEEGKDTFASSQPSSHDNGGSLFSGTFGGGDSAGDGPPSAMRSFPPKAGGDGFPSNYGMARRTSVSAESMNPSATSNDNWTPPFHQKTDDQLARLKKSISGNFLFTHMDDDQSAQALGALMEKPIPAKDIKVC